MPRVASARFLLNNTFWQCMTTLSNFPNVHLDNRQYVMTSAAYCTGSQQKFTPPRSDPQKKITHTETWSKEKISVQSKTEKVL